jgi:hypothetical protein
MAKAKNSVRTRGKRAVSRARTPVPISRIADKYKHEFRGETWLTAKGAALALGVHWTRIYYLVREDKLKVTRVDNRRYVSVSSIEHYRTARDWWKGLHSPKMAVEVG